jgi:hypothetical protein
VSNYALLFTTQGCGREAAQDYDAETDELWYERKMWGGYSPLDKLFRDEPEGNAGDLDRIAAEKWLRGKGYE